MSRDVHVSRPYIQTWRFLKEHGDLELRAAGHQFGLEILVVVDEGEVATRIAEELRDYFSNFGHVLVEGTPVLDQISTPSNGRRIKCYASAVTEVIKGDVLDVGVHLVVVDAGLLLDFFHELRFAHNGEVTDTIRRGAPCLDDDDDAVGRAGRTLVVEAVPFLVARGRHGSLAAGHRVGRSAGTPERSSPCRGVRHLCSGPTRHQSTWLTRGSA